MNRDHFHDLRENYGKASLDRSDLVSNPIDQFRVWFNEAMDYGIKEPNAMTLSTVNEKGEPSGRIVLMKDLTSEGVIFYTNLKSNKAKEISYCNKVSLTFLWLEMERQIRINGKATQVPEDVATSYFQSRPKASQIGAWASTQSEVIQGRDGLEARVKDLEDQYKNEECLPKPPFWSGYLVTPKQIEFWQGRKNRLHDRMRYELKGDKDWQIVRLSP
jgi:pyridoxamine 5'-phosphate oxidase